MKLNKVLRILGISAAAIILLAVTARVALPQGPGGSTFNYIPNFGWYEFTDNTGTWHAPIAIHNGSAPSNSVTELTVNTDNQFQIQTYALGNFASLLDLDTDGSVALYGASGGGVGGDAATGDTCIPAVLAAPCGPNSMRIGTSGIVTQYRGQTLAGDGISSILYWADTSISGSFGPYAVFTTNSSGYASSGMYRMSGYIVETAFAPGATMHFAALYTDETGAQEQDTGAPVPFGTVGSKLPFEFVFSSEPGKTISFAVNTSGAVTYGFHMRLEAL